MGRGDRGDRGGGSENRWERRTHDSEGRLGSNDGGTEDGGGSSESEHL